MPSHYNRKNSTKLYLETCVHSFKQLYDLYKEDCINSKRTPLSRSTFSNKFNEKNVSLYKQKKDQCDTCVEYAAGNLNAEVWNRHQISKERARQEKERDKQNAQDDSCIVSTMDLQAVSPFLNASAIFFKTKLTCHNFTVYDLISRHATCYWFTETATDLVASTFTSCIIDYITRHCLPKQKPIIIYSDGCTYQNRNTILSNALLNLTIIHNVSITQKFRERGHTQIECDSVHAAIERKLKNKEIHLPSDYLTASLAARSKPSKYKVIMLEYDFFKDYSKPEYLRYSSIRPGRKAHDPVVTNIKDISYLADGAIKVKLNFDEEYKDLPIRPKNIGPINSYAQLNKGLLPIPYTKWCHLQQLKSAIPKDCHPFYDTLPYKKPKEN